jgi:hypothetical protein
LPSRFSSSDATLERFAQKAEMHSHGMAHNEVNFHKGYNGENYGDLPKVWGD